MSTQIPGSREGAGCWKIGLITCGVIAILVVGLIAAVMFWGYRMVTKNPEFKQMITCSKQLHEVNAAIERYKVRNSTYPQSLNQLSPTFLSNSAELHCPADPNPNNAVSYTYNVPPPGAPKDYVILVCNRHRIKGQPITFKIQIDGKVAQQH